MKWAYANMLQRVWSLDYNLDIPDICLHNKHNLH